MKGRDDFGQRRSPTNRHEDFQSSDCTETVSPLATICIYSSVRETIWPKNLEAPCRCRMDSCPRMDRQGRWFRRTPAAGFMTILDRYWRAYQRDIGRGVRSEERVFSEQERSGTCVQVDGILCRRLPRWLCQFRDDRRSPKRLVGAFILTHRMTQLKDDKMLSTPRLKTDVENARLKGSLFRHDLAA
jgi:hypothetical protein